MSSKKKTTGLGTAAFFKREDGETVQEAAGAEGSVAKMRTSVMLSPEVVAGIETLRAQARKKGHRLTTSEIIEDALRLLMRERNVMP